MATMLNPRAQAGCIDSTATLLPADPFTSLRYHFGMLLGVDDFETDQAYHRGKIRLHNAWLHGQGVVWGLAVRIDRDAGELEVFPGLALDGAGRELHLTDKACLSLPLWFDAHRGDADLDVRESADGMAFDAHVVIRVHPCLFRQVPAFADACNGADTSTAYSRVEESVELLLLPGLAPDRPRPYHRLRLLFALEPPIEQGGQIDHNDREVLDARTHILGLPADEQPAAYREALVRFAAFDGIDLRPAQGPDGEGSVLFPAADDSEVVLADIRGLTLRRLGDSWQVAGGETDVTVRPSHVATSTIQELTCGPLAAAAGADAGGPRIDPSSVAFAGPTVTIPLTAALHGNSVGPHAFSVTTFSAAGWIAVGIASAPLYDEPTKTISLTLSAAPAGDVVRLVVRGTGDMPLLGANLVPLAGAIGGPPGSVDDGHDFVLMRRS